MINGIQLKFCGLTRVEDAQAVASAGTDFLGFIFYEKSPRRIEMSRYREIKAELPDLPKVAVTVCPSDEMLAEYLESGFDRVQIHFPFDQPLDDLRRWSSIVGRERLWIAPKMPPGKDFNGRLLEFSDGILWDAYRKDAFGGTGETSDWDGFATERKANPGRKWILAGGLGPDNVVAAIRATGATMIDLNSGVEQSPGFKDLGKIARVAEIIERI